MVAMDTGAQKREFRSYQLRAICLACLVGACAFIAGSLYFDHVQVSALVGVFAFGLAYDKGMKRFFSMKVKKYEKVVTPVEVLGDDSLAYPYGSRMFRNDGSLADPVDGYGFNDHW